MSAEQLSRSPTGVAATLVTVETVVAADHVELFYDLYLTAFQSLRTRAVARHLLHHDEFVAEMNDPRVWKYVAWDDDGRPVGLTTLTQDLDSVPWISPDYFAHRYPRASSENRVFYLGFTLTSAGRRQYRVLAAMLAAVIERLSVARAVCGYDICAFNNDLIRFAEHLELMMHRLADVTVDTIDTQTYYSATFG